jgi:hypothetical protein
MTLKIVSAWVGHKPEIISRVVENHRIYALKHRYDCTFFDEDSVRAPDPLISDSSINAPWVKIAVIRKALETSERVFWVDADSVFYRPNSTLRFLETCSANLVFTGDRNDICNTGHLFFRRSDFSRRFLDSWETLRTIPFPPLATTHQDPNGLVADQPAFNYLLGGGKSQRDFVEQHSERIFNRLNGWNGNPDRVFKNFARTHAPVRRANLRRAKTLIDPALRKDIRIVSQTRINAYPWRGPAKGSGNRKGPIVHFVSPWKDMLDDFFEMEGQN